MDMKGKIKRIFIAVLGIVIFCLILFLFILHSLYLEQFKGYVNSLNSSAVNHYKVINSLTDYKNKLDVTETCNCVIYGESDDYLSYTAYAGDFLNEDLLFYGNNSDDKSKQYWAVKIVDGEISEIWVSTYPLEDSDLQEYTLEEQIDTYRFLTRFSETEVVGYYKVNNV